jgi:transposase-like protein
MRKKYEESFKVKVALAALQEGAKVNEVAAKYEVHPNKVMEWRKHLLTNASGLFANAKKTGKQEKEWQEKEDTYLKLIGEKDLEVNWFKKKLKHLNLL